MKNSKIVLVQYFIDKPIYLRSVLFIVDLLYGLAYARIEIDTSLTLSSLWMMGILVSSTLVYKLHADLLSNSSKAL